MLARHPVNIRITPYREFWERELLCFLRADNADIVDKKERLAALKADPYYNALQIKFAMAVTCHKAQGGGSGRRCS